MTKSIWVIGYMLAYVIRADDVKAAPIRRLHYPRSPMVGRSFPQSDESNPSIIKMQNADQSAINPSKAYEPFVNGVQPQRKHFTGEYEASVTKELDTGDISASADQAMQHATALYPYGVYNGIRIDPASEAPRPIYYNPAVNVPLNRQAYGIVEPTLVDSRYVRNPYMIAKNKGVVPNKVVVPSPYFDPMLTQVVRDPVVRAIDYVRPMEYAAPESLGRYNYAKGVGVKPADVYPDAYGRYSNGNLRYTDTQKVSPDVRFRMIDPRPRLGETVYGVSNLVPPRAYAEGVPYVV